ncbi:MAG TPA: hypothetical protein VEB21_11495 [Terriglobales bacterium]|nr:hypothetical protein [Terriglobales bacterium]
MTVGLALSAGSHVCAEAAPLLTIAAATISVESRKYIILMVSFLTSAPSLV